MTNQPPSPAPSDDPGPQLLELQAQLTYQQRMLEELNTVVLEQQTGLEKLRREVESLQNMLRELAERQPGDDLPDEKPPHY